MKSGKLLLVVPFISAFNVSADSICPAFTPATDGCSFPKESYFVLPGLTSAFADIWRNQCNQHDINYQTLGKSKSESDDQLHADMKNRCDSKFNKYLTPSLNLECKSVAKTILEVLRNVPAHAYYTPNQSKVAAHYREYSAKVDNRQCKTTVEKTGFIEPNLLASIKQIFQTKAGRLPTAYERLRLVALYSPAQTLDVFLADVNYYSQIWGQKSGPTANFSRGNNGDNQLILNAANSVGAGLSYRWDLNQGSSQTALFQKSFHTQYNQTFNISGVLEVTDSNNNADFMIINEQFMSRGECAPSPEYQCL